MKFSSDKTNIIPLDKDWHLRLSTRSGVEAKAKQAVARLEQRQVQKYLAKPPKIVQSISWADPSERLFTLTEIATHFGVEEITIRRAVWRGELVPEPCGKNGKILRFSRSSIDSYKNLLLTKRHG